jgi:glycerophosphoryl diester phosphodiesterase
MLGPSATKGCIVRAHKLLNLPPVIGHRGAAARAPENTLAGFRAARALGCTWVEFDVRLTSDGAVVVCHDDQLKRTTDGRGQISKLPLAAIRQWDAGSWFGKSFVGEMIPTLDETLDLCRELELGANVEIKAEPGRARATAAAIAVCLDRQAERSPFILVSSFLPDAIFEMAERAPSVPRGMLFRRISHDWAAIVEQLGCATVNADHHSLSESLTAQIVDAGYPLLAYTVNDAARARQLFDWGVASVFSDTPNIILEAAATIWPTREGE